MNDCRGGGGLLSDRGVLKGCDGIAYRLVGNRAASEEHLSFASTEVFPPGQQVQQSALPAAAWSNERAESPLRNTPVHRVQQLFLWRR